MTEKKKKKKNFFFFTESAAFCRVGRVTGNNNKFLLGPIMHHFYSFAISKDQEQSLELFRIFKNKSMHL